MIPQNQRSPEWKKWRQTKIGASDASSIMGANAFKSIGALLDEKLGIRAIEEENDAMARGNELEDEARDAFEALTGFTVFAQVCPHPEHPWMIASLDGMSVERDVAVEIKCPGPENAYKTFRKKEIPVHYIPQLQHQMAVTGLSEIYYYSYFPHREGGEDWSILLKLERDDEYIEWMIEKEKRFYNLLTHGKALIECFESDIDRLKEEAYKILGSE